MTRKTYSQGLQDGYRAAVLWHRADPAGCLSYLRDRGLDVSPPFELVSIDSNGKPTTVLDVHQVLKAQDRPLTTTELATELLKRAAGLKLNPDAAVVVEMAQTRATPSGEPLG